VRRRRHGGTLTLESLGVSEWVTVASTGELGEGELLAAEVDGEAVVLARVDGIYHAIGDVCTHAECSLGDGWIEERAVVCVCHGSAFDLATGEVVNGPAKEPERVYQVRVAGEEIQLARR
jgi:nitrite reductase/ring-hydroxylating ferredoxin subunit